MRIQRFISSIVVLGIVVVSLSALAEDWPTYRHDRTRTGVSDETLPLPLDPIWVFQSHQFRSAPTFTGNLNMELVQENTRYTLPIAAAGNSLFFTSSVDGRVVCFRSQ